MFQLKKETTFTRTAIIDQPTNDDAKPFETHEVRCRFRVLTASRIDELMAGRANDEDAGDLLQEAFLETVDPIGQEGHDGAVEFTEALRQQLLAIPYIRAGLMRAYLSGLAGRKRKN